MKPLLWVRQRRHEFWRWQAKPVCLTCGHRRRSWRHWFIDDVEIRT